MIRMFLFHDIDSYGLQMKSSVDINSRYRTTPETLALEAPPNKVMSLLPSIIID